MTIPKVLGLLAVPLAVCLPLDPPGFEWQPPTATDRESMPHLKSQDQYSHGRPREPERCPCPFTNTLANHGFIPRSGLDVPGDAVLAGMDMLFNIDPSFTIGPVTRALGVSTSSINGSFNLRDVNIHGRM